MKSGLILEKFLFLIATWANSPIINYNAGNKDESVVIKLQFREFVRLQIGSSNESDYKNWYKISNYLEWQSIKRWINEDGQMKDNNSRTEFNNN